MTYDVNKRVVGGAPPQGVRGADAPEGLVTVDAGPVPGRGCAGVLEHRGR
ncbi:hypothetical protein [Micromonospora humida]